MHLYLKKDVGEHVAGTVLVMMNQRKQRALANQEPHLITHTRYRVLGSNKTIDIGRMDRDLVDSVYIEDSKYQVRDILFVRTQSGPEYELTISESRLGICDIILKVNRTTPIDKGFKVKITKLIDHMLEDKNCISDALFIKLKLNKHLKEEAASLSRLKPKEPRKYHHRLYS